MKEIVDANGNKIENAKAGYLKCGEYVTKEHHQQTLFELADALVLLEPCANALAAGRDLLDRLNKSGLINDENKNLLDYLNRTKVLLQKADAYLAKWKKLDQMEEKKD